MKKIDMSLYEFTEEEKLIIAHEKALRKEKRKLFTINSILVICAITLLIFQLILIFNYGLFRESQSITSIVAYLISAVIAVPLTILSIVPIILSVITLGSTNKYIRIASIIYLILSVLIIILNIVYIVVLLINIINIF